LGARIDPDFQILAHYPHLRCTVDIGGNWGQSIHAIRRLLPQAQVISFEPNPVLSERLGRSFSRDGKVAVHNLALSSQPGNMELYVPVYREFIYDGLASLNYDEAINWLNSDRMASFDSKNLRVLSFQVNVEVLDNLDIAPDFIKIDVQGHEIEVLKGSKKALLNDPLILLEGVTEEIVDYLGSFGMKPYAFDQNTLISGAIDQNNTIFMSEKNLALGGLKIR